METTALEQRLRVGFASQDWSRILDDQGNPTMGGSGHYRCALPAKVLREMGYDARVGTLVVHRQTGEFGVQAWNEDPVYPDVVVMQRWMHGDLPPQMHRARANGQVLMNDVDDWWEGLDPTNRAWMTSHPRFNLAENTNHYRHILAASDYIVCSTPFLEERYRRLAPTVLVRNVLDLDRWRPQEPRGGPPTLGWVGAIPWRSKGDLEALAGFLGPFVRKHDLRVRHHGAIAPGWDFAIATGIDPWRLDQRPLVPISEHERQFEDIDIALIPLADKPFNEAKSALKGMQAAAAGVPYVASQTPEYQWMRLARGIGQTARRTHHWINHLTWLMDPSNRARTAMENEARVQGMGLPVLRENWRALLSALPVRVGA